MPKKYDVRIQLTIDKDTNDYLAERASIEGVSKLHLIRTYLDVGIAARKQIESMTTADLLLVAQNYQGVVEKGSPGGSTKSGNQGPASGPKT